MEISLKVFQTGISVDKISFELLNLMKENHSHILKLFLIVTNLPSIYYRIKTLHKIVDYMEDNFTFEEINQIFSILICVIGLQKESFRFSKKN